MRPVEIVIAAVFAVVCAAAAVLIDTPIRRFWKRCLTVFSWWAVAKQTGLVAIYPRTSEFAPRQLKEILKAAQQNDTVLLVARTNLSVVKGFGPELLAALGRGVTLKFLMFDSRALDPIKRWQTLDPRAFGAQVTTYDLAQDGAAALSSLQSLRTQSAEQKVSGDLLVYRTPIAVHNSAVILDKTGSDLPRSHVLFDISFGKDRTEKFTQFYDERAAGRQSFFVPKLIEFYKSLYSPPAVLQAHLSYCNSVDRLDSIMNDRVESVLTANPEYELIRHNSARSVLPVALDVFHSLRQGDPAPAPLSAQVELTNMCSTRCEHCDRWAKADDTHMERDTALAIMDQLVGLGVRTVTLSGGEPTQHPQFAEVVSHARLAGLRLGILSNGIGLSEDSIDAILQHSSWLRLSIDGVDGHTPLGFSAVRIPISPVNTDRRPSAQLLSLIQSFRGTSVSHCQLAICYTIQARNIDGVRAMIDWVRTLGLPAGDKTLVFKIVHGDGNFRCTREQLFNLLLDPSGVLQQDDYRDAANLPYLRRMLTSRLDLSDVAEGVPTRSLYLQHPTRCFTPYTFLLIDPHGDVYPCCYLYQDNSAYNDRTMALRRNMSMGHFDHRDPKSLASIWNGPRYQKLRSQLAVISPSGAFSPCAECTRHCNHNVVLTQILEEYSSLHEAGGITRADRVMQDIRANGIDNVWL